VQPIGLIGEIAHFRAPPTVGLEEAEPIARVELEGRVLHLVLHAACAHTQYLRGEVIDDPPARRLERAQIVDERPHGFRGEIGDNALGEH
jgi:hypothetical protein